MPLQNIAIPALVLVFSLVVSPRDLYYRGQKDNDDGNNNNTQDHICSAIIYCA